MPARKRPEKTAPTRPERDVRKLQKEAGQTEEDFLADLDRASTKEAEEKLERAARRDRESPKT